jgi:hypothetical protein
MNRFLLIVTSCFISAPILPALAQDGSWRDDRPLLEAYHTDLAAGRLDAAILKVLQWCTEKYQNGIKAKNLDDQTAERLALDIQEAAKALRFVRDHGATIRRLDDGTRSFGVFLGCFEVLFGMSGIRDGAGEDYEQFMKAYYESRKVTEGLIEKDANSSRERTAEQAGAGQPATAPESTSEGKEKPQPESKPAPR